MNSRRDFVKVALAVVAMPMIVRWSSLMPVHDLRPYKVALRELCYENGVWKFPLRIGCGWTLQEALEAAMYAEGGKPGGRRFRLVDSITSPVGSPPVNWPVIDKIVTPSSNPV